MTLVADDELAAYRTRGREAVMAAGQLAMRYFQQTFAHWEKEPGQIVTDADIAVDRFLHGALMDGWPADGWLSEESPDDKTRLERRFVWVVDPIDGTRSFAQGIPEFTICLGLLCDNEPVLGFVFNPATNQFFEAERGQGAFLNGAPMQATTRPGLAGAHIVVSGVENRKRRFADYLEGATLATIGSLALKLCLVAASRYDGYLTWRRTHDWDIAAAVLILREAGAVISDPDGGPIRLNAPEPWHAGIVAGGPALHRAVILATAPARARFLAR